MFEKIIIENFPRLMKDLNPHVLEGQWNLNWRNTKKIAHKAPHSQIAEIKVKEQNLKAARENRGIIFKEAIVKPMPDVSTEPMNPENNNMTFF